MPDISRNEELILLAILRLKDNAYGVTIRKNMMEVTRKTLYYGSLYNTLDLLMRKGYVEMRVSNPVSVRGGRSKKLYHLTPEGVVALRELQEMQNAAWSGIPDLALKNN